MLLAATFLYTLGPISYSTNPGGSQEHISLITDRQTDRQTLEAASKGAAAACRSSNETQQRSLVLFVGTKSGATGSYRRTGGLQHPRVLWKGLQVCYCK